MIKKQLEDLTSQLPTPFILLGDFNGHNPMWGCNDFNNVGTIIEDFISANNICLMNNKKATYLHPATGHYSALDLTLCHPTVYLDYSWDVHDDTCGSDHFPIILQNISTSVNEDNKHWRMNRANWDLFNTLCSQQITPSAFENVDNPVELFTNTIHTIASKSIPKTTTKSKRHRPWFDENCKRAIRRRRAALKKFNINPTTANLDNIKILRAQTRKTIRQAKRTSWQKYVSKLNSKVTIKKVWSTIKSISGKSTRSSINHLKTSNGKVITNKKDISNTIGETLSKNSSSSNYTKEFQNFKTKQEKQKLKFQSNNDEDYNKPFSLTELKKALDNANNTAAGPDDIPYQFLKHLPNISLELLLSIYNDIWTTGVVPNSWKNAFIIPIPKQGKDLTDPSNYRPIALTSCICKTFERMVNYRLVWYLETNNLINEYQSGFRHQRSTNDHLVRLESFVRDAFIKKEHLVSVFFDLEKAYDTTWKYGILKDMGDLGLKGRLPNLISSFLSDRNFQVKMGSTLSSAYKQEQGVPQGSILSVTLFNIKINSIVKCLNPGVDCSLYVDDFVICYRSKHMNTIERQLQQCLNKLHTWSSENGFKFSRSKTNCVHFCQMRKLHEDPKLFLNNVQIPVVEQAKFLGVIFDKKLSFIPHIKYVKSKCLKALNILKVLSNTDWGADRKVLLQLYRALIRSKLDYGSIVYGSARKSYLQMLDVVHNQGLRLALGAFRTSPVESLLVEANEPSLYIRREKLTLQYITKIKANQQNPAYDVIFNPKYEHLYTRKPKAIRPIGLRVKGLIEAADIRLDKITETSKSDIPPWTIDQPKLIFDLANKSKSTTDPLVFRSRFNELREQYDDYFPIYTDGSKTDTFVGSASVSELHKSREKLPFESSIFTAEIRALQLSLRYIKHHPGNKYIIFSDSLSALQAFDI